MTIRWPLLARRFHKWLALFVGIQAVIWTLSGLYMTAIHIDIIHGDHLVRSAEPRRVNLGGLVDPLIAGQSVRGAQSLRLQWLLDRPVYAVAGEQGTSIVDARSGAILPAPAEAEVREIAELRYNGTEEIITAALINEVPFEIRGRKPPLWRVQFDGWNKPTFYISAETGELLTRRHELWRVFDFLFGLHIMDYWERENVNNLLLRLFSWSGFMMAISGAWLLLYSFPKRKRRKAAA